MSPKRPLEESTSPTPKKPRKGFTVGPANLPDGTYKRKTQAIKRTLIEKAKIKKEYAKVRARALESQPAASSAGPPDPPPPPAAPTDLHPDRLAVVNAAKLPTPPPRAGPQPERSHTREERRERTRFHRQNRLLKLQSEAEKRRAERGEAVREKERKVAERERFRRQMANARRPGRDGKRKLGRESKVLFEKVKRMVGGGTGPAESG